MPKTPGEFLVENYPDEFSGRDPSDVDQSIRAKLIDPVARPKMLATLRRDIGKLDGMDDATVLMDTLGRIEAKRTTKAPPDPARARVIQDQQRLGKGAAGYSQSMAQQAELANPGNDAWKAPPDVLAHSREIAASTLTPRDVVQPRVQGDATRGIPAQYERFEDMKADAAKHGLRIVQAHSGVLGSRVPAVQLVDAGNNTVAQLNPAASFHAPDVEGLPRANLGEITGQGSTLQQALTETARDVYDPKTGQWFRGADPRTGKTDVTGAVNPLSRAQGYGFREYGMDLGGRQTDNKSWKVANVLASPLAYGLGAVDKAEEWLSSAAARAAEAGAGVRPWETASSSDPSVFRQLEQGNREEAEKYFGAGRQLLENAGVVGNSAVPDTPEATAEANRGLGATMGEALSMRVPTGGDMLVKAAAPLVAKGVGATARGASRLVEKAAPDLHAGVVGFFSSLPAATTVGRDAADVFKGAQAAGRNSGDLAEMEFVSRARDALQRVMPEDKVDDALREAKGAWHSVEARKALSPEGKAAVEALQPMHEEAFRAMFGTKFPYNPMHVFRGQRATKNARVLESARMADAAEDVALYQDEVVKDVGRTHFGPHQRGGAVPGWDSIKGPAELREARSWKDTQKMLQDRAAERGIGSPGGWRPLEKAEFSRAAEEMEDLDMLSGMAKTYRMGAEARGLRERSVADTFFKNIQTLKKEAPGSYMPVDQRFGRSVDDLFAKAPDGKRLVEVNAYRDAVKGGRNLLAPEVSAELAKADEVVLRGVVDRTGDVDQLIKATDPKRQRVVFVPGLAPGMDGMVMPRVHALALQQAGSTTAMERTAAHFASTMDKVLGLTQLNYAITKGNPGFEARNRISELWRMSVDDADSLSDANRELVQRVLNARPGEPTTYGRLHAELISLGGLGKGFIEDVRGGRGSVNPGPVWLPSGARKVLNAPAKAADAAQDLLVNDSIRRGLFPKLPKGYTVEDGFRAAVMLNEIQKGTPAVSAAAHMKRLLIDYGDYNAAERFAKPFIPFIKYYTGATEGAVAVAMKNPRRFARVYDMARIVERWDTEFEGGGRPLNQKLKSTADVLGASPLVQEGDSITALRPETTAAEAANQLELLQSGLGGLTGDEPERGLGANLGPLWSGLADLAGGISTATGRSTVGLGPKELDLARSEGAWSGPQQALWAYQQRQAGLIPQTKDDKLALAKDLLRYMPVASRVGDAPWLRLAGGVGTGQSNPASRSDEALEAQLRRGIRSMVTGLRSSTITPSSEMLKQQRLKKQPTSRRDVYIQNVRQGKVTP